jgi:hypothetical protein
MQPFLARSVACALALAGCGMAPRTTGSEGTGAASSIATGQSSSSSGSAPAGSGSSTSTGVGGGSGLPPASATFETNETLKVIPTRPGVTLPFDLVTPAGAPKRSAILLTGSNGELQLSATGIGTAADNFVVRTREQYAAAGFVVALPDVPSDEPGGLDGFRTTAAHAEDMAALIAWLRKHFDVPVWMVGTSRGTISAANAAARLGTAGPDGIVLTSSITAGSMESLNDVALGSIAVPVQVIHNELDACPASPFAGAQQMIAHLALAPLHPFVPFDGGEMPQSNACGALSYHGFFGLDAQVVPVVVAFVGN